MPDFKGLARNVDSKERKSDSPMCRLPGGLFVVAGETVREHDVVKYKGKFSIKYGPQKSDWVRMSYIDAAVLFHFMKDNSDFIEMMLNEEREEFEDLSIDA